MALRDQKVPAVVLAGGINRIPLYQGFRPGLKALLRFADRPSLHYVLDALRKVPRVGDIAVVGPKTELQPLLPAAGGIEILPDAGSLTANLLRGARHFSEFSHTLFLPADLPLLTPRAIEDFLSASLDREIKAGHFYWAMVERSSFRRHSFNISKGFDRFRDLSVCHGNLYLLDTGLTEKFEARVQLEKLYRARKSALRSALVCGPRVLFAFLFGVKLAPLLTLHDMARLVSRRFGLTLVPVLVDHPEVALDVDEPEDYAFVRERLETR